MTKKIKIFFMMDWPCGSLDLEIVRSLRIPYWQSSGNQSWKACTFLNFTEIIGVYNFNNRGPERC